MENSSLRKSKKDFQPTYQQLMDSLGLSVPDLAQLAQLESVPHFYDGLSKDERDEFLSELENVTNNKSFQKVMEYWLKVYAHFIACQATSAPQIYGGWLNTNVISLIKKDLRSAHEEILLKSKEEEPYDPYEITFGNS